MRRERWTGRRVLIGLAALGAVLVTIGGAGAAACKLFLDCGIRSAPRYDESRLKRLGAGPETKLPPGFRQDSVVGGLAFPTDFAFLPDGRILIGEKHGIVRVVKDGHLLRAPFLDISARVSTDVYRGLMTVRADPDFARNGYVYLVYSQRPRGSPQSPTSEVLSRVTARGDTAVPGSERIILGTAGGRSCLGLPEGSNCIPAEKDHIGADIAFAADGTMFVSTGDGGPDEVGPTQLHALDLDYLGGKILHVTTTGKGVPSNPFWNGDPDAIRSKVWAYGLRNPFRMVLDQETGTPYPADVGDEKYEEVDVAGKGVNLGWPCYEGRSRWPRFATSAVCKSLYAKGAGAVTWPAVVYRHYTPSGGQSITGGAFYTGTAFPQRYRGAYFYADWASSWVRAIRFDSSRRTVGKPMLFATGTSGPVAIREGPDGSLYYLAFNASELRRISYTGG